MAALGNALGGDVLRRAFVTPATERAVRPLLGADSLYGGDGTDALSGATATTCCQAARERTG